MYNNHPVKKYALSLITVHMTLQNYQKITDTCLKYFGSLQNVDETQMRVCLSIYSK